MELNKEQIEKFRFEMARHGAVGEYTDEQIQNLAVTVNDISIKLAQGFRETFLAVSSALMPAFQIRLKEVLYETI